MRWKKAISGSCSLKVNIIKATWLRVDKAIIFFISHSDMALALAINIVTLAIIIKKGENNEKLLVNGENRYSKKTPAVTRVEEWTRALTGVGAAIAAGSHLEKGICALFVIAATMISMEDHCIISEFHLLIINQCPWLNINAIVINSITSPTRFLNAVIIPAPRLLALL